MFGLKPRALILMILDLINGSIAMLRILSPITSSTILSLTITLTVLVVLLPFVLLIVLVADPAVRSSIALPFQFQFQEFQFKALLVSSFVPPSIIVLDCTFLSCQSSDAGDNIKFPVYVDVVNGLIFTDFVANGCVTCATSVNDI